jgi:coatomer protein complex subunit alpha (xenin)
MDNIKSAYKAFTVADFTSCEKLLDSILKSIPLTMATTKSEGDDLRELVGLAREYLIAVRLKLMIDGISASDIVRSIELSAYFTHCNLQPSHMILALKTAMAIAFKNKVLLLCLPCIKKF